MSGVRKLLIAPAILGAILCVLGMHVGQGIARADGINADVGDGAPIVDQALRCVTGYVLTSSGCVPATGYNPAIGTYTCVAGQCGYHNPFTGTWYPSTSYWYPYSWTNYTGSSWWWCTWPGGGGWYQYGYTPPIAASCS
jgi:hypothetical protein